jgi:hypothetical protein
MFIDFRRMAPVTVYAGCTESAVGSWRRREEAMTTVGDREEHGNRIQKLPLKVGNADTDGVNDAYEAVVYGGPELIREAGYLLREDPKGVIRRMFRMNAYQRAVLAEMPNHEVRELVAPVLDALGSRDPTRSRLRFSEIITTNSPLKGRCHVEITIET